MRIACIGWGSLIWDSRNLEIPPESWAPDGPVLPIEFTRISLNSRVTLIIDEYAEPITTLWTKMKQEDLDAAMDTLAIREGLPSTRNIGSVISSSSESGDEVHKAVLTWLRGHKELDAAIWTALSYRVRGVRPSAQDIIKHLESLTGEARALAEEYIRKAPPQIDTVYRRHIYKTLDWTSTIS